MTTRWESMSLGQRYGVQRAIAAGAEVLPGPILATRLRYPTMWRLARLIKKVAAGLKCRSIYEGEPGPICTAYMHPRAAEQHLSPSYRSYTLDPEKPKPEFLVCLSCDDRDVR